MFCFLFLFFLGGYVIGCGAQEFAGSLTADLSWSPPSTDFSLFAVYDLGVYWDAIKTNVRLKLEEGVLSEVRLDLRWYRRPYRLQGRMTFAGMALDGAMLEARYWKMPWMFKVKGSFSSGEPFSLEFWGTYEDEGFEAECYLAFEDHLSLVGHDVKAIFHLTTGWELLFRVKGDGIPSEFYIDLRGPTPWGRLYLKSQDFSLTYIELHREWSWGGWDNELTFAFDAVPRELILEGRNTRMWSDEGGWGARWRVVPVPTFGLEKFDVFFFDHPWKLILKAIDREIWFKARYGLPQDAFLNVEASLYPEGWEAEMWFEWTLGGVEWTLGCYLYDEQIDEIYAEIYLEF
ncbi:hypothetical protein ACVNPS_03750 [Candidatus Bipolaricaulota sp. J31]